MKLNIKEGHWPPGGWQYFDPKTGYRETKPTEHDRREAAQAIMAMRKNNPHIYKGGDLTYEASLEALELFTARRLNNQGLSQFLVIAPTPVALVKKKSVPVVAKAEGAEPAERSSSWIDKIRKLGTGASTLRDWVGGGMKPVDQATAERRAKVCVACPLNKSGGLVNSITASIASAIHAQSELKNNLKLATPYDSKLNTCSACECPLPLKVWVPSETILNHTSKEVMLDLDKDCWIPKEA